MEHPSHRTWCLTSRAQVRIYSRAATIAQDAIDSIKTIHAFGAQPKIVNWYDTYLQKAHKIGNKESLIYGVMFSTQTFLVMSGTALAFWEGFRLFQSGEIQHVGTVFTVVLSVTLGAKSVLFVLPQMQAITNASSAASDLFSIIDKQSLPDPLSSGGRRPTACAGEIEIRGLRFVYPTRPTALVLQDLRLVHTIWKDYSTCRTKWMRQVNIGRLTGTMVSAYFRTGSPGQLRHCRLEYELVAEQY